MIKAKLYMASLPLLLGFFGGKADASPINPIKPMRAIEAQIPRDPLVPTSDPIGKLHATPKTETTFAETAINRAIPGGTALPDALTTLQQAGFRCSHAGRTQGVLCSYRDVQTVDEYLDSVRWDAAIQVQNGSVRHISLNRFWNRH